VILFLLIRSEFNNLCTNRFVLKSCIKLCRRQIDWYKLSIIYYVWRINLRLAWSFWNKKTFIVCFNGRNTFKCQKRISPFVLQKHINVWTLYSCIGTHVCFFTIFFYMQRSSCPSISIGTHNVNFAIMYFVSVSVHIYKLNVNVLIKKV
jgi:hypothetical protein